MYEATYKANPNPGVGVVVPSAPLHPPRVDLEHGIPSSPPAQFSSAHRSFAPLPQQPKKRSGNRWLLMGGGIIFVIVLCVAVGLVVFHLAPAHKPIPAPVEIYTNCISCSLLEKAMRNSGQALNTAEVDVKNQDGNLLCCLKTTIRAGTFLEMLLDEAQQSSAVFQDSKAMHQEGQSGVASALTPPNVNPPQSVVTPSPSAFQLNLAAALLGLEDRIPPWVPDDQKYILKEWGTTRSSVTFIRKEIKFNKKKGTFRMPRDGLYIINVHLGLANRNMSDVDFGQRLLRLNRHFPQTDPEELAYDSENIPPFELRTSSLSSVFNLRKDDEIFVEVGPPHVVVESSSRSYFSVFLLSE